MYESIFLPLGGGQLPKTIKRYCSTRKRQSTLKTNKQTTKKKTTKKPKPPNRTQTKAPETIAAGTANSPLLCPARPLSHLRCAPFSRPVPPPSRLRGSRRRSAPRRPGRAEAARPGPGLARGAAAAAALPGRPQSEPASAGRRLLSADIKFVSQ